MTLQATSDEVIQKPLPVATAQSDETGAKDCFGLMGPEWELPVSPLMNELIEVFAVEGLKIEGHLGMRARLYK